MDSGLGMILGIEAWVSASDLELCKQGEVGLLKDLDV